MVERRATQMNGWVWCALAAVLFGAATPVTKLLIDDVGSVTLAGLLYVGAALALAPFGIIRRRSTPAGSQRSRLAVAVVLGGGIAPVLLLLALDRTPAGTVSLLLNLELVATAAVARVFLNEHIGGRAGLGIVIVVLGGVTLAGTTGTAMVTGALLVGSACLCWGIDNAITASIDRYSPARITLIKGIVAGSVNLALGIALDGRPELSVSLIALAIGAVGYGLSITMWITGARLVGAARGQAIFALAPFVGALLAWPVNGDRLSVTTFIAFALCLIGVLVVGSAHHRHQHVHERTQHAHPIDVSDKHHGPDDIEVIGGDLHRHRVVAHEHDHLPDIHHRHGHTH